MLKQTEYHETTCIIILIIGDCIFIGKNEITKAKDERRNSMVQYDYMIFIIYENFH